MKPDHGRLHVRKCLAVGMPATVQCSIDPPRLLVCISKINHSFELMSRARMVGVHVVDADQRDLAELFGGETGDDIDKFAACMWRPGPCGLPVLTGCRRKMIAEVVDQGRARGPSRVGARTLWVHVEEAAGQLQPSEISDLEAGAPALKSGKCPSN